MWFRKCSQAFGAGRIFSREPNAAGECPILFLKVASLMQNGGARFFDRYRALALGGKMAGFAKFYQFLIPSCWCCLDSSRHESFGWRLLHGFRLWGIWQWMPDLPASQVSIQPYLGEAGIEAANSCAGKTEGGLCGK